MANAANKYSLCQHDREQTFIEDRSQVPMGSRSSVAVIQIQEARFARERAIRQSPPTSAKNTYVPAPQAERIRSRYVAGESIRSISRTEKRDRSTIAKIVRSAQMDEYVAEIRAEFIGLAREALALLIAGMRELTEPSEKCAVALRILQAVGVIQAPVTKHAVAIAQTTATPAPPSNNPSPQEMLGNPRLMEIAHSAAIVGVLRSQIYGTALPELDETEVKRAEGLTKNLIAISAAEGPVMD